MSRYVLEDSRKLWRDVECLGTFQIMTRAFKMLEDSERFKKTIDMCEIFLDMIEDNDFRIFQDMEDG